MAVALPFADEQLSLRVYEPYQKDNRRELKDRQIFIAAIQSGRAWWHKITLHRYNQISVSIKQW